ncbi:MAG: MFS transporter [Nanobdellota archaeon]
MNYNYKHEIYKLYLIKTLKWFMLIMPIVVIFFQENGLNLKKIMILQAIFSISIILFEIPSGYFSDVLGRKKTIIIGCTLGFIGFFIYSVSYGFYGFLLAELILGLGSSFISGTDSAMIYDILLQNKKEKNYTKIEGRMNAIGNFSESTASIFGSLIALISLRLPFYAETAITFLTIPIAFTLIEPKRHFAESSKNPLNEILRIVKYSMHHNREIKWLIIYSGFVGASTLTMVWFIQPYLKLIGVPLALFGLIWALLNFSVGIFSIYAYKIEKLLGRKISLVSLIIISFIGYILLGLINQIYAIIFIFLFYLVRGISLPIIKDYINKLISSNMRATVLSVKSMFGRLIFSIIGPFIGFMADFYTLQIAFINAGIIFLIFGILSLLF